MFEIQMQPNGDICLVSGERQTPIGCRLKLKTRVGQITDDRMLFAIEEAVLEAVRTFLCQTESPQLWWVQTIFAEAANVIIAQARYSITDNLKTKGVVSFELETPKDT